MDCLRLAAIQPRSHDGAEEYLNVTQALDWMGVAAAAGADIVVFPEGYPGPVNPANVFDSLDALSQRAADLHLHVVAGGIEPAGDGRFNVVERLIGSDGSLIGTYRRTTPVGPYVYLDLDTWSVPYVESADPPQVFETNLCRIGLLTCSEVYVPELARILALQGADLILCPSGGAINELLESWRIMIQARAIENLVYVATVQNMYDPEEQGVGIIASPEGVLAQAASAGMLLADLDLNRLTFLRERDERIEFPKPYRTIPGVMRWRRPELYGSLLNPGEEQAS